MVSSNASGRPDQPRRPQQMTCSTCGRRFLLDETPSPPFCSRRCQLIDLGRWLDEEIGLPHEGDPGESPVEYRDESEASRESGP